ncbi:polyprenyl synthetase family protein [[Eubacterium] cellulosolvens]
MNVILPKDEAFHHNTPIEWWYATAYLTAKNTTQKFSLVSSFFSYSEHRQQEPGHMLIYALNQLPDQPIGTTSLVDKQLRDIAFDDLKKNVEDGSAGEYAKAYYESLNRFEIPKPHKIAKTSSFSNRELFCQLDKNLLARKEIYHLHLEDEGFSLDLNASPTKPVMLIGNKGIVDFTQFKMKYYSYPRVMISGTLTVKDRHIEVAGSGWLDHQWGDWFKFGDLLSRNKNKRSKKISWQWFGLQLGNGIEINTSIPGDNSLKFKPYINTSLPQGTITKLNRIETKSKTLWQSLRTLKIYPVGWTVKIPELELNVELEELTKVELPVLGPIGGVLEVLYKVNGKVGGKHTEGLCWAETLGEYFQGSRFWSGQKTCVNTELEEITPRHPTLDWVNKIAGPPKWERDLNIVSETFTKPLWDLLDRGGKRWRPLWMCLCCDAVGGNSEKFRNLLPIPELFHAGSLIVDDIEDQSKERRGEVSLHIKYGIPIALNAANSLYYIPLILLEDNKHLTTQQRYLLYKLVSSVGRRAHLGQAADIYLGSEYLNLESFVKNYAQVRKSILQTYADKTGVQARALAEIGGIIGKGNDLQIKALSDYSEIVGMTFQLIDDIMALESHQKGERGVDISQGKLRLITLEAIVRSSPPDSKRLIQILSQRTHDQQLIEEAITIIKKSEAIDIARKEFESLIDEYWNKLSPLIEESDFKVMLRAGPKWLLRQKEQ